MLKTCDAVKQPTLASVTLRLLHSSLSMIPLPFPPETTADRNEVFGVPCKQALRVVVSPFVTVTLKGPAGWQPCGMEETDTV